LDFETSAALDRLIWWSRQNCYLLEIAHVVHHQYTHKKESSWFWIQRQKEPWSIHP